MEEDDDESSDSDASDKNVKKSRQLSSVVRVKQVQYTSHLTNVYSFKQNELILTSLAHNCQISLLLKLEVSASLFVP